MRKTITLSLGLIALLAAACTSSGAGASGSPASLDRVRRAVEPSRPSRHRPAPPPAPRATSPS